MKNKKIQLSWLTLSLLVLIATDLRAERTERVLRGDWLFAQGELSSDAAELDYDASDWTRVSVPHDWAISGPFNPSENGYAGKLPWQGVGWYRREIDLPAELAGSQVYLDFDGVMAFPEVYVNGHLAGSWDYGYMSFRVDATPYVKFGQRNVVAVKVDTRRHGTRWYPGAGIYRKVKLTICDAVHFQHWGIQLTTPQITDREAVVRVRASIDSHLDSDAPLQVRIALRDPTGKPVSEDSCRVRVPAGSSELADCLISIADPQRWDVTAPRLYSATLSLIRDDAPVDSVTRSFGIRTFKFTADDGFHLNGRRVQLYGVNLHHDHGPLGAAFYPRAMQRQLEIMRDMGCNAIRTSHNPPAPELLELCDRMGFVVWDECFDKWDRTADRIDGQPPLEEHANRQLKNLVMRDRNHPSVVVWSIGNEINNQPYDREGKSPERVKLLSDIVRKYDDTRPVGIGCHIPSTADQPILDSLDVTGWNYARRYENMRRKYPDKPLIYSESASTLSTRGFYELPLPNSKTEYSDQLQVDSYDHNAAAWSDIPDAEFDLMERDRFVAGEFVWTGFDYLGEPTPFSQQARSSYFGIVDLCGIPKDRFYLYRSHWRPDTTTVHLLPHWNWADYEGQVVPVYIYTNGDEAELFLNGQSLGRRRKGEQREQAPNFALGKSATASSTQSQDGNVVGNAVDGDSNTRWCAEDGTAEQWWQVDLGEMRKFTYVAIEFEREAKNYGYEVQASKDGEQWTTLATKRTSRTPRWGGPRRQFHDVKGEGRFVRIQFQQLQGNCWASVRELGVYPQRVESPYYAVLDKYRLRWLDVHYEPGELKAVAYKDGAMIGQAVVRTAGAPAKLRLTADRSELVASGLDLSYIQVEALDAEGNPCPLAGNQVKFDVRGPAAIAGVGNGNPLSLEPFQAASRKLFFGKAMLILRAQPGAGGDVSVTARSDGLESASVRIQVEKQKSG